MDYKTPFYCELGSVGETMNPLYNQTPVRLIQSPIATEATRNMADAGAGYVETRSEGLDGRQFERNFFEEGLMDLRGRPFERNYFEPGAWELHGRHVERNFFEPQQGAQLYGWRDAMDVISAATFLFPA